MITISCAGIPALRTQALLGNNLDIGAPPFYSVKSGRISHTRYCADQVRTPASPDGRADATAVGRLRGPVLAARGGDGRGPSHRDVPHDDRWGDAGAARAD